MTPGLLVNAAFAGAAYTITPGPAFLALLGIGAGRGRRAGALFLAGHFVGDITWATLSLISIIGAKTAGTTIFHILGFICGIYLCWLGIKAITARQTGDGSTTATARNPLRQGLVFGASNPKAYPVAVAIFTALLAEHSAALDWTSLPPLLIASSAGSVMADIVLIAIIGGGPVRRWYQRHALTVTRVSGVIFVGFGLLAIISAVGQAMAH